MSRPEEKSDDHVPFVVVGITVAVSLLISLNISSTYASQSTTNENLIVGKTSVVRMYDNGTQEVADTIQITGFYFVITDFSNGDAEPKSFDLITMVVDSDNVAREILIGGFTVEPKQNVSAGTGFFLWIPQAAGNHTLKTFVWSSLENNPQPVLVPPNVLAVMVDEKIISLGTGEGDHGLLVKTIDLEQKSVTVSHEICAPTGGEREQALQVGDFAPISTYARAYLDGFDNEDRAVFRFEGTGQGLCQLICHHSDSADVYLAHYIGN